MLDAEPSETAIIDLGQKHLQEGYAMNERDEREHEIPVNYLLGMVWKVLPEATSIMYLESQSLLRLSINLHYT